LIGHETWKFSSRSKKLNPFKRYENAKLTYHERRNWIWWRLSVRSAETNDCSWHLVFFFDPAREFRELDRKCRDWIVLAPNDEWKGLLMMALDLKREKGISQVIALLQNVTKIKMFSFPVAR
jgi:hypothetical protein